MTKRDRGSDTIGDRVELPEIFGGDRFSQSANGTRYRPYTPGPYEVDRNTVDLALESIKADPDLSAAADDIMTAVRRRGGTIGPVIAAELILQWYCWMIRAGLTGHRRER